MASFAGTSQEVGGKLGLGRNKTLVAVYSDHQVVHHQHEAVILTLVANNTANTGETLYNLDAYITAILVSGHLMNLTSTLQSFLTDISAVIEEP